MFDFSVFHESPIDYIREEIADERRSGDAYNRCNEEIAQ
jgi:hypothetical protein